MVKVKICGVTNADDAICAARAGADYIGFVFAKSQRRISPLAAKKIIKMLPKRIKKVGVFVNEDPRKINAIVKYCKLDIVQLHGDESPGTLKKIKAKVIKAFRIRNSRDLKDIKRYGGAFAVLLDSYVKGRRGGTGKKFNWKIAKDAGKLGCRIFLAGGITPGNVSAAIARVRPYAVDSSSGVEMSSGMKDKAKVKKLIRAVKG